MNRSDIPPDAALIRLVRDAANMSTQDVASKAGISAVRLTQIENGYETRGGQIRPVRAKASTMAHIARALDISPERLDEEGERPDAVPILREILRSEEEERARQEPDPAPEETPSPDGEIRLPPAIAAQMSDTALKSILPQIVAQVDSVLARNPKAAGRDIFPESAEVADVWDRFAPYPRPRRIVFAAMARLEEMRREWREGLSG